MDIYGVAPLLEVFDMPTSLHFYRDVLGFAVFGRSGPGDDCGWIGLRLHGAEVMLNTAYDVGERPESPDPGRQAAHADTCLFFGCEDLDAAYRHLRQHGVKAKEPRVAPYGMRQLSFHDPDNYGVCLQWPATQETYDAWVVAYGLKPKKI
jgi:glyoxylase I family protein